MDDSVIRGLPPTIGIGRVGREQGKKNGRKFEEAFREEAKEGETTAESEDLFSKTIQPPMTAPMTGGLQRKPPIIRKGPEDGEFHIDVLA